METNPLLHRFPAAAGTAASPPPRPSLLSLLPQCRGRQGARACRVLSLRLVGMILVPITHLFLDNLDNLDI